MPTYQYQCDACHHSFEIMQSMLDKKLKKCPACGKNKLHRLIGAGTGIIFKGSGFYETDYKKKEIPSCGSGCSCACPASENAPSKSAQSSSSKKKAD
ncbi:MAG TPA: zinc ribbon domain-containing protein [Candidatus Omnitrophota bacterium]|nr:zinc ribbon domain-containing protein [Candidatus Omnitrophota bacterium]